MAQTFLVDAPSRQKLFAPHEGGNRLVTQRRRASVLRIQSRDPKAVTFGQYSFKTMAVVFAEDGVDRWIESAAGSHQEQTCEVDGGRNLSVRTKV